MRAKRRAGPLALQDLLASQKGQCKICGAPKELVLDHDLATSLVRGYLCRSCNLGLGAFKDSAARLSAAIAYLEGQPVIDRHGAMHAERVGESAEANVSPIGTE